MEDKKRELEVCDFRIQLIERNAHGAGGPASSYFVTSFPTFAGLFQGSMLSSNNKNVKFPYRHVGKP